MKYELGKQAKTAELKALPVTDPNPHFLYNTLDMIKWFSYSGRNEDIDKVVTRTCQIL
ncbi:MAG: sensor histidine kinase [Blautia faecis]